VPRVSVVLPVYNEAELLPAALESVLRERCDDLEVVAVDDGSTDETPRVLAEVSARDPRVAVYPTERRGLVAALNEGLARASGEIIVRMDADDLSLPGRVSRQVAALDADPGLGLIGGQVVAAGPAGAPPGGGMARYVAWQNSLTTHEAICRDLFVESPLVHPSIAARASLLRAAGGYRDGDFPEDYDLWLRLLIGEAGAPLGRGRVGGGARAAKLEGPPVLEWRDRPRRFTRTDPRCRPEAFRRLKVEYLLRSYLLARPEVVIWGAGLEGKPLAKELIARGASLAAFLDIDPRKIGQRISGARVLSAERLPTLRGTFVVVAVGAPGAREIIRAELARHGFLEGRDACFAA
jgi:glycosyltransferase involved in cell wall biosynthesis